jgi:predicted RND superfamily exporter protein
MRSRTNNVENRKSFKEWTIDLLVERRKLLAGFVIAATLILGTFIPQMKGDPTLKSAIDPSSKAWSEYKRFIELFGTEEFMLVAMSNRETARHPSVLQALDTISKKIANLDHVTEVLSLTNLKMFMEKDGRFGVFSLVTEAGGQRFLVANDRLDRLRKALPLIDFLLSPDTKTVGVLIRVDDRYLFDVPVTEGLRMELGKILREHAPEGSEYRIVGPQLIRAGIQRYNVETALVFGILCLAISTLVSVYIFKSLRVTFITLAVVGMSVAWILAFMSVAAIPLSSTTGLSFGLVLVVSVATVIRIVTHFNERYALIGDKIEACRQALQVVLVPCLMCSVTTAVGFGTIMVSTIPMVFQLGLIMCLGVMVSFSLAMALTPTLLILLKPLRPRAYERMAADWMAGALARTERAIFHHYRTVAIAGIVFTLAMLAGAPFVRSDTQVLRMLSESTAEVKDLQFVEKRLGPVHSLELLIEAPDRTFRDPGPWKRVAELAQKLQGIPEVVGSDSLLPLLAYMAEELYGSPEVIFTNPKIIPELIGLIGFTLVGKEIMARYTDKNFGKIRVSVKIKNSPSIPISETIRAVGSKAKEAMKGVANVAVTGDIAVFAAQAALLVRSQLLSLALAFVMITILMMIQLGSPMLGLISLIPNVPPVAAIFGVMGWLGISLDTVTVFAATVALGLAVDDTIHYLAQLKQEIRSRAGTGAIEECVRNAHEITAKAMLSTSAVLFFGFVVLVISPFRPVVSFGILGSTAILTASLGDVMFLPSVILASTAIRGIIHCKMRSTDLVQ